MCFWNVITIDIQKKNFPYPCKECSDFFFFCYAKIKRMCDVIKFNYSLLIRWKIFDFSSFSFSLSLLFPSSPPISLTAWKFSFPLLLSFNPNSSPSKKKKKKKSNLEMMIFLFPPLLTKKKGPSTTLDDWLIDWKPEIVSLKIYFSTSLNKLFNFL